MEKRKVLIDSNIVILLAKGALSIKSVDLFDISVSEITRLEVMGYHLISIEEETLLNAFFNNIVVYPLSSEIIELAIKLRKEKSMSVGDAIIASTSLHYELPLMTANVKDFDHIDNLELLNPLKE